MSLAAAYANCAIVAACANVAYAIKVAYAHVHAVFFRKSYLTAIIWIMILSDIIKYHNDHLLMTLTKCGTTLKDLISTLVN